MADAAKHLRKWPGSPLPPGGITPVSHKELTACVNNDNPMRNVVCALLALLTLVSTANANTPPGAGAQRVPLGDGRALTIPAPKCLTSNAHVGSFLVRPNNADAAYTDTQTSGDTVTQYVKWVGLKRGKTRTLLLLKGPVQSDNALEPYELVGWSGDGRYLLVRHDEAAVYAHKAVPIFGAVWDSVDIGVSPFKVRRVRLPREGPNGQSAEDGMIASPSGKLFALEWETKGKTDNDFGSTVFIYHPARHTLRSISLPDNWLLTGWADDTHLLFQHPQGTDASDSKYNIVTKKVVPASSLVYLASHVPRRFPEIMLSLSVGPLTVPAPKGGSRVEKTAVSLLIKGSYQMLRPVFLAVVRGSHPVKAALAPDQSAAFWIQNGDLYACTFAVVPVPDADKAAAPVQSR